MEWNWSGIAAVLTAIGGPSTLVALWKWAKAQAKAELLTEEAQKTIAELTAENDDLKDENMELKAEKRQQWALLEALTRPEGRP